MHSDIVLTVHIARHVHVKLRTYNNCNICIAIILPRINRISALNQVEWKYTARFLHQEHTQPTIGQSNKLPNVALQHVPSRQRYTPPPRPTMRRSEACPIPDCRVAAILQLTSACCTPMHAASARRGRSQGTCAHGPGTTAGMSCLLASTAPSAASVLRT